MTNPDFHDYVAFRWGVSREDAKRLTTMAAYSVKADRFQEELAKARQMARNDVPIGKLLDARA